MSLFLWILFLLPLIHSSEDPFWGNENFIPGESLDPVGLHHEEPEKFIEHLEDYLAFIDDQKEEIKKLSLDAAIGGLLLLLYLSLATGLISALVRLNKRLEARQKGTTRGVLDIEDYVRVVKRHGFSHIQDFLTKRGVLKK